MGRTILGAVAGLVVAFFTIMLVELASHQAGYRLADVVLIRLITKDPQIERLLELLSQRSPVCAYRLQPFKHHALLFTFLNQSGVAFLAALIGSTDSGH